MPGSPDATVDLGSKGTARNGEGDQHPDVVVVDADVLDHAQVDDAAMELWILDRPKRFDDLGLSDRHEECVTRNVTEPSRATCLTFGSRARVVLRGERKK